MAIVVYRCDTCKRKIEKTRNIKGLENIQRCTITHGCRGKLYQIEVLEDFVRGSLPDTVAGLDDWQQRKVLYNHEQTIERDEWIINHNLGTFPTISVFISVPLEEDLENVVEIIPEDVIIINEDTILLKFDAARSGIAQLVARQSDPDLLRPIVGVSVDVPERQQIAVTNSQNGEVEITVATKISTVGENTDITLNVEYTTVENSLITTPYVVSDDTSSSVSPWKNDDKVVIKGKTYTIRSFNAFISEMQDETIGSGSNFRFISIDDGSGERDILRGEVYILFAQTPFAEVDKTREKLIDVVDVDLTNNQFSFIFDSNNFFAEEKIIQDTYPLIRSIKT